MKKHITNKKQAIERIGDQDIYREITNLFAKHIPVYKEQLLTALKARDLPTVKRVAHSIKSTCATIGAENLRKAFALIEQQAAQDNLTEVRKALPPVLESLTELEQNIRET